MQHFQGLYRTLAPSRLAEGQHTHCCGLSLMRQTQLWVVFPGCAVLMRSRLEVCGHARLHV
jgi:hypothetical protein